jgi:WD40 repeat protein
MELWLFEESKSTPQQITKFQCAGMIILPSWAPDGRSIVFSFRQNGATNLFSYDIPAQKLKQITSTHNRDISPVYSGDGRYLYYSSNDDGTSRIWRVRTDNSSRAEPMFVEAVTGFQPSPDGKWLYFLRDGQDLTLLRRDLEDGATEEVFHVSGRPTFLNGFAFSGGHVFLPVSQGDSSTSEVYEIDPGIRSARIAIRLKGLAPYSESGVPGFSVSADGTKLITAHTQRYQTTLYTSSMTY